MAPERFYLAREFQAIHGVHPYVMTEARFRQLHGFSQRAARDMGMYPECGPGLYDDAPDPPRPYDPGPSPWTSFLPGLYRTSVRFLPSREPVGEAECMARTLLLAGQVSWNQLRRLFAALPHKQSARHCQVVQSADDCSMAGSFTVGGFSHAFSHGLRRHTRQFPWTCVLLTSIVRMVHCAHRFTTINMVCNIQSLLHADSHNDADTCNLMLPFSTYSGGGLWIEHVEGDVSLTVDGPRGFVHDTQMPVVLKPRCKHATYPWHGQRCHIIAFHVRNADRIPSTDMQDLLQLGFVPREDAFWHDADLPSP